MTETHDPQADAIQQEPVVEGKASPQSEATEAQVANDIQASSDAEKVPQDKAEAPQTCEDIIARIKVLAEDPLNAPKEVLDQL